MGCFNSIELTLFDKLDYDLEKVDNEDFNKVFI